MNKILKRVLLSLIIGIFCFSLIACKKNNNNNNDNNGNNGGGNNPNMNDEYYQSLLDEFLPDVVEDNIDLPAQKDNVYFVWSSSDERTISRRGIVNRGRKDIVVTMSMEVIIDDTVGIYSKEVTVPAITFPDLRPGKIVFGYYSTWHYDGYSNLKKNVDVINLSFAYVYPNFTLDMSQVDKNIDNYLSVRKYGVRVVLSVQGYGANGQNFSDAASTAEGRKKLADEMLKVVETYHFDGIDIDWEYPTYETSRPVADKENYTLLMQTIYATFKMANEDYLVTAALPGGAYGYKRYNLKDVEPYIDYLHLMTYDLEASGLAVHHSALYVSNGTAQSASADASVEIYNLRGFPMSKIVIGIAFYGKYTSLSNPGTSILRKQTSGSYKTLTYESIYSNYISKIGNGVTRYWDSTAQAPYLYDENRGHFVTYEDEQSIEAKCKYARDNSLAGVMIWELGEDYEDRLLEAVFDGMRISIEDFE